MILLAAVFLVAIVVLPKLKAASPKQSASVVDYPYTSKGTLFSPAERSFLGVLEQCLPDEYRVHGKVRLSDILKAKTSSRSEWQKAFNRINSKHVDFVITRRSDAKIMGIIELDDKSHDKSARKERDAFVDRALGAAAISGVHVKAKASYTLAEVSQALTFLPAITQVGVSDLVS